MDSRLKEILKKLKSCTIDQFVSLADSIVCVKFDPRLPEGRGYLFYHCENMYRVNISAHSAEHLKLITFIHEIFHIPLLREEFCHFDTPTYWLVEHHLDEAAEIFLKQHSELVIKRLTALSKTS
jgi:hypothetical protein